MSFFTFTSAIVGFASTGAESLLTASFGVGENFTFRIRGCGDGPADSFGDGGRPPSSGPESCFLTCNGDETSPPCCPPRSSCCNTGKGPDLCITTLRFVTGVGSSGEDDFTFCSRCDLNVDDDLQSGIADSTDLRNGVSGSGVVSRLRPCKTLKDLRR